MNNKISNGMNSQVKSQSVLTIILLRYVPKWRLFLASIIIALLIAFIYLKIVNPVYEIKASLVVADKDKVEKQKAALDEIDLANTSKKVEIEMEVLKSRPLIKKVITDLNAWSSYYDSNKKELYNASPIVYKPIDNQPLYKGMVYVKILDASNIELTLGTNTIKTGFDKAFKSAIGLGMIKSTKSIKNYIGSTIGMNFENAEDVITKYQSNLETRLVDKLAPIIELSYKDQNKERGKDFLNYLIAEYKNNSTDEKNKLIKNTLSFIDERLGLLSGELTTVEKDIEGYKSSRGLTDISAESNIYLQNMQSNDGKLNEVNVQLQVIEGIENAINKNSVPATIGIEDKGLVNLIDQLSRLQLERNKLLATTPETNYLFAPIKEQIQTTTSAIRENVKNIKLSLLGMKSSLQNVNTRVESSIKSLPGQERGYISIKRQQGIKENLYTYLLQKREEVALSYATTLASANIIEMAYVNAAVWPKKSFVYAIALIIALIITASIIFIREIFSNTISFPAEVEDTIEKPILSEITSQKNGKSLALLGGDPTLSQQFRVLRSEIDYLHENKEKGRITVITSSKPGEGKSFIASNLSASLASSGRKTIVIELNLQSPCFVELFQLPNGKPGITNFLNKKVSINEILQHSKIENLDVITSGEVAKNPSELIESKLILELLSHLTTIYDDIIIDTPALKVYTDVYAFASQAGLTLFVIRKNVTKKSELSFVNKLFNEGRLPKLNLILNG
ncbi:GumC family protein [Pedobacter punctiformis]|uniref:non-specific protein-tyrosine kinase n=1 Tax=Pedobacter punctiformis TaxID=3004097 RepID=A0ABT4L891_9SPHI|nr:polysaccharide biosynthesis tyrosine autokinase [Pedobacter sp. HCMS5-2]MCZ4244144.1 polysaccharide biosynthesis tyrosine autokinase [Pedobacter sp. HCMS5-2]